MPTPTPYETPRQLALEEFGSCLQGNAVASFMVISTDNLSDVAAAALRSSADRLGYAPEEGTFITLAGTEADPDANPDALFNLIEALDPLFVVATDEAAVRTLSKSYNKPLHLEAPEDLLGRSTRCFSNMESLLETDKGKAQLWHSLKTLPQRAE